MILNLSANTGDVEVYLGSRHLAADQNHSRGGAELVSPQQSFLHQGFVYEKLWFLLEYAVSVPEKVSRDQIGT